MRANGLGIVVISEEARPRSIGSATKSETASPLRGSATTRNRARVPFASELDSRECPLPLFAVSLSNKSVAAQKQFDGRFACRRSARKYLGSHRSHQSLTPNPSHIHTHNFIPTAYS